MDDGGCCRVWFLVILFFIVSLSGVSPYRTSFSGRAIQDMAGQATNNKVMTFASKDFSFSALNQTDVYVQIECPCSVSTPVAVSQYNLHRYEGIKAASFSFKATKLVSGAGDLTVRMQLCLPVYRKPLACQHTHGVILCSCCGGSKLFDGKLVPRVQLSVFAGDRSCH